MGLFNVELGPKGEKAMVGAETELCIKTVDHDYKIYYNPNAITYHRIEKERLKISFLTRRAFHNGISDAIYELKYKQNRHKKKRLLFIFIITLIKSLMSLIKRVLWSNKSIFAACLAICRASGRIIGFITS